VTSEGLLWTR